MGVSALIVDRTDLLASVNFRLDPKSYRHHQVIRPALAAVGRSRPLGSIATFSNGVNLPKAAYADPADEVVGYYLSVRALASYSFSSQLCNPLRATAKTKFLDSGHQSDLTVRDTEVLITRSRASAPGLSMSGSEIESPETVVPSGFVIRANLSEFDPTYVTAILNHPVWRSYTAGLAAGKSQDNLSQELLEHVPVPQASQGAQQAVAARYRDFLSFAKQVAADDEKFAEACDQVLLEVVGLQIDALPDRRVRHRSVPLLEVAESRTVRLDNRWHGVKFRSVIASLAGLEVETLGHLLSEHPAKGRQPTLLLEGEDSDGYSAAATSSLRFGVVSQELLKPTTLDCVEAFPVRAGDVLVAMDGDGSVGKCAVYGGDETITADSHLARLRVDGDIARAAALSCWLNSSWGQYQTNGMMSGATGQTQLSTEDLLRVQVPEVLLAAASEVAEVYLALTTQYVPARLKVRSELCNASAEIADILLDDGVLNRPRGAPDPWSHEACVNLMHRIYPSVR